MLQNSSYKYYYDNLSPGIRYDTSITTFSINSVPSPPATDFEFTSNFFFVIKSFIVLTILLDE